MKTKFFSYIILISLFNENFNTSLGNYQKYQERSENGFRTSPLLIVIHYFSIR